MVSSRSDMGQIGRPLRQAWRGSRAFRIILIVALVYAVLRLVVHGAYLAMMLYPSAGIMGGMPEWTGAEGPMVPNDLQDYLDASANLRNGRDLYPNGSLDRVEFFQYAPAYALAFTPFLWMSPLVVTIVHSLLHIAAYALLYVCWARIFRRLGFDKANQMMAGTVPVWLVFSAFWSDIGYLNIYIIMALLGTLLVDAILDERLGWSLLWLSLILQAKPQWAFAAIVPLLLGRYSFFLRLLGGAITIYLAVSGLTILIVGPSYGWDTYWDYYRFLLEMPKNFPWRNQNASFLGYNHSIKQILGYLLGDNPKTMRLATALKLLFLTPLAVLGLRCLSRPIDLPGREAPLLSLDLSFAFYTGAFIWLDMVWELSLGIVIFVYLLATLEQKAVKGLISAVFLPYALIDLWQLLSFAVFGMDVIAPGPYVLTDPSIYIPMIMILIMTFYALLTWRAWKRAPAKVAVAART